MLFAVASFWLYVYPLVIGFTLHSQKALDLFLTIAILYVMYTCDIGSLITVDLKSGQLSVLMSASIP